MRRSAPPRPQIVSRPPRPSIVLAAAVPGLALGDNFRREIASGHEVLLFSGDLDVRTPLEEQEAATAGLTRLHRILVRNGGHNLFEAHPAVPGLLVDLQARVGGSPLDVGMKRWANPSIRVWWRLAKIRFNCA